ncbi:MAG: hemerythrin domain-containing protein [Paracoccaceae bacterium]
MAAPHTPQNAPADPGGGAVDLRRHANPLDALAADHQRQRDMADGLWALADARDPDPELARDLLGRIQRELPLHMQDEDADLFPLLRRRAEPEDDIGEILSRLDAEHEELAGWQKAVLDGLKAVIAGDPLPDPMALRGFAEANNRHMTLENAVILPLARARLTRDDLTSLRLRMAARRGIDMTGEDEDAQ